MSSENSYIVSARKYRPSTFRSVVGQHNLSSTLKNAIASGRLAQAYLFCGPRGVGKTSCARIFAKTINCLSPDKDGEACGCCESCVAIDKGNSFDLVELDAASNNSVDDIRAIGEQVNVPPQAGRYRVFIIDEVHMLSTNAFNAFLKTLEEPPANVIFILATTEKHKVIPTILSRCQTYDFKRITINDIVDHLEYVAGQEGITVEREALGVIASKADGAMRDALSIFDQVSAATGGNVTFAGTLENLNVLDYDYYFRLVDSFRRGDVAEALLIYNEVRERGFDSLLFVNGLASHIRDLMVAFDNRTVRLLETSEEVEKKYLSQAPSLPVTWYYEALRLLNDCDFNYRTSGNKRLLVELTLIRLSRLLSTDKGPFELPEGTRAPLPSVNDIKGAVASSTSNQGYGSQSGRNISNKTSVNPELGKGSSTSVNTADANPEISASNPIDRIEPENPAKDPSKPIEKKAGIADKEETEINEEADSKNREDESNLQRSHSQELNSQKDNSQIEKSRRDRPRSFSLSETLKSREIKNNGLEKRTRAFTDEEFMKAWEDFIYGNPSLHILVNAMRSSVPTRSEESHYRILVDHPAQIQAFELSMSKLLGFLRDRLENDMLSLHVELSEKEQISQPKSPRELLRQIVEKNPALGEFIGKIGGELG